MGALTVHNIAFRYDSPHPVLRNLSLAIQRGEFLSLAGPNGSGKSTLLRLLDRILIPDEGEIRLFDRPLASFARADLARTIAFVPQDSGITFPFSVLETVLMGRSPHSRGSMFENAGDRAIALDMMRLLDIGHLAEHPVTALSGGERQRVFIARALAQKPEVLLLDEPNAHLDIAHQLEVFRILRTLNRHSGLTVVSVSHDLNLASAFSDRIALLRRGSIAAVGTPGDVMTEQLLFDVFRTGVMVDRHPVDGTARVTLVTSVQ